MSMVTVFRSFSPAEAHVIRSRLDAAQFHSEVVHELSAFSMEGYSLATGGVLVQVPAEEVDDARTLITAPAEATDPA